MNSIVYEKFNWNSRLSSIHNSLNPTHTHTHTTDTSDFAFHTQKTVPDRLVWASHWKLWIFEELFIFSQLLNRKFTRSIPCKSTALFVSFPILLSLRRFDFLGTSLPNIQSQSSKTLELMKRSEAIIKINSTENSFGHCLAMYLNVNCVRFFPCLLLHLCVA